MEASEKPQLRLDGSSTGPDGVVRALDDRLVIERLTVTDDRAARVVRERAEAGQEAVRTVQDAIEIGARVLDREDAAAEVDYVRAEFERHASALRERLGKSLEDGEALLAEQIVEAFDGDDSVQAQIREIVAAGTQQQTQDLIKLLTSEDGSNPLVAVQTRLGKAMLEADERHRKEVELLREGHAKEARSMHGQVAELRKELAQVLEREDADTRVADAEDAGTRKGFTFEERVNDALEAIAAVRGDVASHTGAEAAEGGGKKGDTLVELGAAEGPALGRLLFEAKDKKLSKNQAWAELNEGMAGRAASFGVLVVAGQDRVPAGRDTLTEYEGNKMIVAVDRDSPGGLALEVAYRLGAARVAMARDRRLQVDAVAVRDTAQEALSLLRQAQAIRSTLSHIKTSSDKARSGLDVMVESVEAKLDRIESLIAEADEAGS